MHIEEIMINQISLRALILKIAWVLCDGGVKCSHRTQEKEFFHKKFRDMCATIFTSIHRLVAALLRRLFKSRMSERKLLLLSSYRVMCRVSTPSIFYYNFYICFDSSHTHYCNY